MTRVIELEQEIRRLINAPRKHRGVSEDRLAYHMNDAPFQNDRDSLDGVGSASAAEERRHSRRRGARGAQRAAVPPADRRVGAGGALVTCPSGIGSWDYQGHERRC